MTDPTPAPWSPDSWKGYPCPQQPVYPDESALSAALGELSRLPPLVTSFEVEALKDAIAEASRGERFILWGGDCAESFSDCRSEAIASKLKILLQMSLVLVHGTRRPIRTTEIATVSSSPASAATM